MGPVAQAVKFADKKAQEKAKAATKKFSEGGSVGPSDPRLADPFVRQCLRQSPTGRAILVANGYPATV